MPPEGVGPPGTQAFQKLSALRKPVIRFSEESRTGVAISDGAIPVLSGRAMQLNLNRFIRPCQGYLFKSFELCRFETVY